MSYYRGLMHSNLKTIHQFQKFTKIHRSSLHLNYTLVHLMFLVRYLYPLTIQWELNHVWSLTSQIMNNKKTNGSIKTSDVYIYLKCVAFIDNECMSKFKEGRSNYLITAPQWAFTYSYGDAQPVLSAWVSTNCQLYLMSHSEATSLKMATSAAQINLESH